MLEFQDIVFLTELKKINRGLDSFGVGQLLNIRIPTMSDENFISKEKYPKAEDREKRIKDIVTKGSIVPCLIYNKTEGLNGDFPTYDIYFWTRSRMGEQSGALQMVDVPIWRYIPYNDENKPEDEPLEGLPPQYLIDMILEPDEDIDEDPNYFLGIHKKDIWYINKNDEIQYLM